MWKFKVNQWMWIKIKKQIIFIIPHWIENKIDIIKIEILLLKKELM